MSGTFNKKALLAAVLSVGCLVGCGVGGSDTPDVTEIQNEAKSDVPKDLGTVPADKLNADIKGGAAKGGG